MTSGCDTDHPDHGKEITRLNRVAGQVEGLKKMILERRYCPDILTQIKAVRSALKTIEGNILETHLHACVAEAMAGQNQTQITEKIDEIKEMLRRADD